MKPFYLMSQPATRLLGAALFLAFLCAVPYPAGAADKSKPDPKRVVVGKNLSDDGDLLKRAASGKGWQVLKKGEDIPSNELLVQCATDAVIESKNGAVHLIMAEDVAEDSPHRAMESAVILHPPAAGYDLDFTLDRGLVVVKNVKKKGEAKVQVRFRDEVWDLLLESPGTEVALELFGRWPRGVPFHKEPKPGEEPSADLFLLVLKGTAVIHHDNHQHALGAPPGPALFHWNSVDGEDKTPIRLDKLPHRATPEARKTPDAKKILAALEELRKGFAKDGVEKTLAAGVKAKDPFLRMVSVIAMGAVDDLEGLRDAINDPKQADVRDTAVLVIRQWIGRGPGQDQKLYKAMLDAKIPPVHAEIAMQLLHSFGDDALARPETYELLIAYLMHDKVAPRELARWHLERLVPWAKIKYDAGAPEAERKKAHDEWKKLIPDGQLPRNPKEKKTEPPKK
jgi:hypothetical protein